MPRRKKKDEKFDFVVRMIVGVVALMLFFTFFGKASRTALDLQKEMSERSIRATAR